MLILIVSKRKSWRREGVRFALAGVQDFSWERIEERQKRNRCPRSVRNIESEKK